MKNFTRFALLTAAAMTATGALADGFTPSEQKAPQTHRTTFYAADFFNNDRMDVYYGGQLDKALDKPGIWGWTSLSTLLINNGDSFTIDALTAVKNDEPNKDDNGDVITDPDTGEPQYNYHLVGTKHGIRLSSYCDFAGIDYNNDGLVDLLVNGQDGSDDWYMSDEWKVNHLSLYRNNGDGTFTLEEKAVFPSCYPDNNGVGFSLAVGDYDRDGYVDFMVSSNLSNSDKVDTYPGRNVALYRNIDGTGEFKRMDIAETKGGVWTDEVKDDQGNVVVDKQPLEGWFLPISGNVHMADLNNDGWLDIVLVGWADNCWDENHAGGGNKARVYINKEGKKFVDVTPEDASFYTLRSSSSNLADMDGDGNLDFFHTGWGDNGVNWNAYLYVNTTSEDAIFDFPSDCNELGVDGTEKVKSYIRDFDFDGTPDIYYSNKDGKITIYYGSQSGTFTKAQYDDCGTGSDAYACVADFNGNGRSDIFAGGYDSDPRVYYNNFDVTPEKPAAPANVKASVEKGVLTITWDDVEDAAPKGYAYNVLVKNGNKEYALVPANFETGFVKVSTCREAALRPGVTTYSIPVSGNDYEVGVQTICLLNETASEFTKVQVSTAIAGVESETAFAVTVNGNAVMVAGNGEVVKVFNALGQQVAAGVAGTPIEVAANGVLVVSKGNRVAKIAK